MASWFLKKAARLQATHSPISEDAEVGDAAFQASIDGVYTGIPVYSINSNEFFAIDPDTGEGTVNGTLNYDVATFHDVQISVSGIIRPAPPLNVRLEVGNVVHAVVLLTGTTVSESAAVDTVVGTFSIENPEGNWADPITYTLTDDFGGAFKVVGDELQVAALGILDFEISSLATVSVEADNGTDATVIAGPFSVTVTDADDTAPVLSSPLGVPLNDTTAALSVATNEGNGALYWVVTQSASVPSKAQVKAGQDHTGSSPDDFGNQFVTGAGSQSITGNATGLSDNTTFYAYFMHEDGFGNQSNVSSSASFTTPETVGDVTAPTLSAAAAVVINDTDATGSVTTDEGNGDLYWVVTKSASAPTSAQIIDGQNHLGAAADDFGDQPVSATGAQLISASGLTANTVYYFHFVQIDNSLNTSNVESSSSFTTDPPIVFGSWDEHDTTLLLAVL